MKKWNFKITNNLKNLSNKFENEFEFIRDQYLAKKLRFFNIKVTCFNLGSIDTRFFESSGIASHPNLLQPKDVANTLGLNITYASPYVYQGSYHSAFKS